MRNLIARIALFLIMCVIVSDAKRSEHGPS